MNYANAKELRDRAKVLIGQEAEGYDSIIEDVIIVPLDCFDLFIAHYLKGLRPKYFQDAYPSKNYSVRVVVFNDGFPMFDTIEAYMGRISDKS